MFGYFDYEKLDKYASENKDNYKNAMPFPNAVIKEAADDRKLHNVLQDFPKPEEKKWWSYDNFFEKKLAFDKVYELPRSLKEILVEMNSAPFLDFLEKLTGIEGLIPDPYYAGGGLHQIPKGGVLKLHCDFNHHRKMNLDRRINVILYLNKNWEKEYNGSLELWDTDVTKMYQEIPPIFNTMVIFNTTDYSVHGHPEPLNCPDGMTRKSLALYYYSNGRPESEKNPPHSTQYKFKPNDNVTPELEEMRRKRAEGRLKDEVSKT